MGSSGGLTLGAQADTRAANATDILLAVRSRRRSGLCPRSAQALRRSGNPAYLCRRVFGRRRINPPDDGGDRALLGLRQVWEPCRARAGKNPHTKAVDVEDFGQQGVRQLITLRCSSVSIRSFSVASRRSTLPASSLARAVSFFRRSAVVARGLASSSTFWRAHLRARRADWPRRQALWPARLPLRPRPFACVVRRSLFQPSSA